MTLNSQPSYWQSKQTNTCSEGCANRFTAVGSGLKRFLFSLNPRQMPSLDFWSKKVSQKVRWFAEPGQMPGSSKRFNSATVAKSTALCFAASGKQQTRYCAVTLGIDILDAARTNW